ncbi:hypothetical protein LMG6871_02863 [Ralstonia edaphis]|nr:hypothetical protein LMG6871_02863 [Ralstonia sp. LMG 6871]
MTAGQWVLAVWAVVSLAVWVFFCVQIARVGWPS